MPSGTKTKRALAAYRLDTGLLQRLDAFCQSHQFAVKKTSVVEAALRDFLDRNEAKTADNLQSDDRPAVASAQV